ncbi:MAG TPA: nitroreductase family protein [Tepidisphaeraceae bacterium]|jgi:nitroreductase
MEKPAPLEHDVLDLIRRRWSPRAFDTKPVEPAKIKTMLEAARWAASSMNEQPWNYLIATKDNATEFAKMISCLVPANQAWAKDAPLLMISVARAYFTKNNEPNRVALHDVGAASAQLTLEALNMGLFVHQMGGIEVEKIRTEYELPPGYEPVAGMAIGYPGDSEKLAEPYKTREKGNRVRKPIKEFAFRGKWGEIFE